MRSHKRRNRCFHLHVCVRCVSGLRSHESKPVARWAELSTKPINSPPSSRSSPTSLPPKHRASAERRRGAALSGDESLKGRSTGRTLQLPRLIVEALLRLHFFIASELAVRDRALKHADRLVIDFDRHGIGVAILAAVRQRETGGIAKAIRWCDRDVASSGWWESGR